MKRSYKMTNFNIVSGGVFPELAQEIAKKLNKQLIGVELKRFANGERYVRYTESVRQKNLFIIQSFSENNGYTLNDALIELFLLIDAAKRASAQEITAVLPILPYARQDRKARNREPISVSIILRTLETIGINRIISVDLHSAQTQAIVNLPFDHLIASPLITAALQKIVAKSPSDYLLVSPDAGRAKETEQYAENLSRDYIHLPKTRNHNDSSKISRPPQISGVKGKKCIIIDDMIDTGGTLITAAETLQRSGAKDIVIATTHGILSNNAAERFKDSPISKLYIVDTISQAHNKSVLKGKLEIIPIAPLMAKAIKRIATGQSLDFMFNGKNNK